MIDKLKYAPSVEAFLEYYLHHLPRFVYNESEIAVLPDLKPRDVIIRIRVGDTIDERADKSYPLNGIGYTIWGVLNQSPLGNYRLSGHKCIIIKEETSQGTNDGIYAYELTPQQMTSNIISNNGQWEGTMERSLEYMIPSVYAVIQKFNDCIHKGLVKNGTGAPTNMYEVYAATYLYPYLQTIDQLKLNLNKILYTDDVSTSVYDLETPSPTSGRSKLIGQDLAFRVITRLFNNDTLAPYGVGSGGIMFIQTTGTKYAQRAYFDRNTMKLYACKNTNTDTSPVASNWTRLACALDDTAV